ncbi:carotenoid biosynthesis protein [Virgisporangium ochraceum]|uniref:Membrane protein n=1 Tax=Virgisporangium ochraceum TaxID=65505 RepID=A0A8J3ZW95_9ACTN|nr:carotenoid biosynthesis protein [Virgisporangium ochraceum]GIJ68660.1 membrane protein [Virgisporangium ochraceum]
MSFRRWPWLLLAALVLLQIGYPLTSGSTRAGLVTVTVVAGFVLSVGHAAVTRGPRVAAVLVVVTCVGGLATEALGVATGFPFGHYDYGDTLGGKVLGVPWVIPLAWTWMAWPAWLAAGVLASTRVVRVLVAGVGLAAWDLFLDPQMVAERYWTWSGAFAGLPGVPEIPVRNYLGWLLVAVVMMALLSSVPPTSPADGPMHALYLWTYCSSVLAHAVFLGLPWSALWGGLGMGLVAVPLGVRLWRRRS